MTAPQGVRGGGVVEQMSMLGAKWDAIRETLELHVYGSEVSAPVPPYLWCVCGWRSDDDGQTDNAAADLYAHITDALMNATARHALESRLAAVVGVVAVQAEESE